MMISEELNDWLQTQIDVITIGDFSQLYDNFIEDLLTNSFQVQDEFRHLLLAIGAFNECPALWAKRAILNSLDFSDKQITIKNASVLGEDVFEHSSVGGIYFDNSCSLTKIPPRAFLGCSTRVIELNEGILEIATSAFRAAYIGTLYLPHTVQVIEDALTINHHIRSIVYNGTTEEFKTLAEDNLDKILKRCEEVRCSDGVLFRSLAKQEKD